VHKPCRIQTDSSFPARLTFLLPRAGLLAAPTVLYLLLYLAFLGLVIFRAALCGTSFSVGLPAAKWTPQILATGISWMGDEKYPAIPAPGQALS